MATKTRESVSVVEMKTPVGPVSFAASRDGLVKLGLKKSAADLIDELEPEGYVIDDGENAVAARLRKELERYFSGAKVAFKTPVVMRGPAFHQKVYGALREVPFGKVVSYGELAGLAGSPQAARAVGQAMANNFAPIVIPCHRVIGSSGKLHGFGGGLDLKRALLELEGVETKG